MKLFSFKTEHLKLKTTFYGETMENRKKIAAATTAVMNYITTEEEAVCIQTMAAPAVEPVPEAYAAAPVKLWGMSGRQTQMQMRNMMQMKIFK